MSHAEKNAPMTPKVAARGGILTVSRFGAPQMPRETFQAKCRAPSAMDVPFLARSNEQSELFISPPQGSSPSGWRGEVTHDGWRLCGKIAGEVAERTDPFTDDSTGFAV